MILYEHQQDALNKTKSLTHVAYYLDMGLGKTFVGSEKMVELGNNLNLLICQKSKINDWKEHFTIHYPQYLVIDYTKAKDFVIYDDIKIVIIVNYELVWRRKDLANFKNFTLMLDESSLIQNIKAKQTKFVLNLKPTSVVLLSGTPCSGKYENLYSQARLLNWDISKSAYDETYINWKLIKIGKMYHKVPNGYKNVDRLKSKLKENGAIFMKTDEVMNLPKQTFTKVYSPLSSEYTHFKKVRVVTSPDNELLVGDTSLTYHLRLRQLASFGKINSLVDLLNSSNDRFVIFYNWKFEKEMIAKAIEERSISYIDGDVKDLTAYNEDESSVTLCQYQAGAMGLNLQKANKIIYFSLPERSDLFEQSKKRIHRIGQTKPCFYYLMIAQKSIDESILNALEMRRDYTDELFKKEFEM